MAKSNLLLLFSLFLFSNAQQPYLNNDQLDCGTTHAASSTLGYSCNGLRPSCTTYLTLRSNSDYPSPVLISYLLNSSAASISQLNQIPDTSSFPPNTLVLVPIPCSCSNSPRRRYYQHSASYTIKSTGETYFVIANNTLQGLSTCQALEAQNPFNFRKLVAGLRLNLPLRCACPTANQTRVGIRYLLTYLIVTGDDVPTIAQRFNADYQSVLDANGLNDKSVIYPYTTLLIPMKEEPSKAEVETPSPPTASPAPPAAVPSPDGDSGSDKKWVFVGIGIGVVFLLFSAVLAWYLLCFRRRRPRQELPSTIPAVKTVEESAEYSGLDGKGSSTMQISSSDVHTLLDSLMVYKFGDLEKATGFFQEDHRMSGSVYRGVINGDAAAVKRLKGDVSNEIRILKKINHSNVVRLSGYCVQEGNTYLVYEFAEKGSLADWLHRKKDRSDSVLTWKQRVRIAYDVADGLNYLHNYANPPYIHKNLKSSNVLLDAEFRAKLTNFGLARVVEDYEGPQLTRHVVGTQGYMSPEYLEHGLITSKLDVFAFGVIILELLSGKEATFPKDGEEKGELLLSAAIEKVLSGEDVRSKLRGFIDPCLRNDYPFDLAFALAEVAMQCVVRDAGSRPAMTEVLMSLSAIYDSTLDWDPSDVGHSGSMVLGRYGGTSPQRRTAIRCRLHAGVGYLF